MNKIFLAIILLSSLGTYAQKIYADKAEQCHLKFIFEDREQLIFYEANDSIMLADFFSGFEEKTLKKLKGVILLQVMVDTAQQVCCVSYLNKSTIPNKKLDVVNRLKNMPGWVRRAPDLTDENICALIRIYIDKYEYKVQHVGYNRNRGKQLLESSVYNRNAKDSSIVKQ